MISEDELQRQTKFKSSRTTQERLCHGTTIAKQYLTLCWCFGLKRRGTSTPGQALLSEEEAATG